MSPIPDQDKAISDLNQCQCPDLVSYQDNNSSIKFTLTGNSKNKIKILC